MNTQGGALALLLIGCAAGAAALDRESGFGPWRELRAQREASQLRVADLEATVANLRREVAMLESDPLALERAIREELGWARPDELVVKMSRTRQRPDAAPTSSSAKGRSARMKTAVERELEPKS